MITVAGCDPMDAMNERKQESGVGPADARMHHAHLFAADLDASIEWYRRWFGAEVMADHVFAGARNVMVRIGDGRLNFYDQPPRARGRNAVHHLGMQVLDLAGLAREMRDTGVELRSDIRVLDELDYLMVEGPDGVLWELFEWKGADRPDNGLEGWFDWPRTDEARGETRSARGESTSSADRAGGASR